MIKQKTFVSGIRASSQLHIGNYLGALKQFVELQNSGAKGYFFIADLHALTTPFEPKQLRQNSLAVVAEYIAAGIDPNKSVLFLQNHISQHAELAWIFNCITPLAELERMTQFKDKATQHKSNINAGLLTYPTLMSADILLYKPDYVPVGDDQVQHVELARIIARKFNNKFGQTFLEPQTYERKPLRIMSLKNPHKKMSKTGDDALMIDDLPADITKKIKKAVTATEGSNQSAGVNNLLLLLRHFGTPEQIQYFEDNLATNQIKYSELKEILAHNIAQHFTEFREKKKKLLADTNYLARILNDGAEQARDIAVKTLREVKQKIGLL